MWILIGLLLGAWLGAESYTSVLLGAILGACVGGLLQWRLKHRGPTQEERLSRLEAELSDLRQQVARLQAARPATAAGSAAPRPGAIVTAPSAGVPAVRAASAPAAAAVAPSARTEPTAAPGGATAAAPSAPSAAPGPDSLDALYERARGWLLGGNTVVRVGLLVLFFGFAFLARYAVEHSLLPLELRLAAIALGGVALLATGWRLRARRSGYAMSMQGGGVAVLYLTAFAAMRLYGMLAPGVAFALLLAIVALAALLAILQNAPALAVIGTAGGFLAPILASTGQGDHVALFAYYTVLNLGVLGIAWKKAWRALNLTGFLFTFSIALAWGARDYRPELLASTEPFLIGFFLMYVAAAVLYAWRQAPRAGGHYVDAGLVFGTPVVGFGLQAALCQHVEYAMAWSALAVGGLYVLLARWLLARDRENLRLLVESFLALGVAFLTLAIPLALDGRWTAAAWAMEGAALLWVGARQSRRLAIAAGLLLQLGAGGFFAADGGLDGDRRGLVLANAQLVGALIIALSGFFASRLADWHRAAWPRVLPVASMLLLVWATLWWLVGGIGELDAWLGRRQMPAATLLFFASSAALASLIARRLDWPALHSTALLTLPGMLLSLVGSLFAGRSPAEGWGLLAWAAAALAHAWTLGRAEAAGALQRWLAHAHVLGLWLLTAAAAWMLAEAADARLGAETWATAALAIAPIAAVLAVLWADRQARWPLSHWPAAYLRTASGGLVAALLLWLVVMNIAGDGAATPLPYLPLFNPLDLALCAALLTGLRWWQGLAAHRTVAAPRGLRRFPPLLAALAFLVANGALLRALHHHAGVAWDGDALFRSDTVQMALSLFWAALGLVLTFLASRRTRRSLWMVGAALLGVVVAKLFLVDMANTATVARIVSFLGAGVLLLVVGYLSPLPPARESPA